MTSNIMNILGLLIAISVTVFGGKYVALLHLNSEYDRIETNIR